MLMPGRYTAYTPRRKLTDYLLSETHSVGRSKARFFREHGFDSSNLAVLEERLLAIARRETVQDVVSSRYGTKYVIDGTLETTGGSILRLRTVWIVDDGETRPRFVTRIQFNGASFVISELDTVVLTRSFPEHHLEIGDVGAVVHVYGRGGGYEVEFVTAAGETVAVLTLGDTDIRPMLEREILHARLLAAT